MSKPKWYLPLPARLNWLHWTAQLRSKCCKNIKIPVCIIKGCKNASKYNVYITYSFVLGCYSIIAKSTVLTSFCLYSTWCTWLMTIVCKLINYILIIISDSCIIMYHFLIICKLYWSQSINVFDTKLFVTYLCNNNVLKK